MQHAVLAFCSANKFRNVFNLNSLKSYILIFSYCVLSCFILLLICLYRSLFTLGVLAMSNVPLWVVNLSTGSGVADTVAGAVQALLRPSPELKICRRRPETICLSTTEVNVKPLNAQLHNYGTTRGRTGVKLSARLCSPDRVCQ